MDEQQVKVESAKPVLTTPPQSGESSPLGTPAQASPIGAPRAWLTDVLGRIRDHPASRLNELLPWNWQTLG
jgi:hypothetical protein